MDDQQRIVKTARAILSRLVEGRYDEVEFLSENNFPQEDIRSALDDYDATLTEPPNVFDLTVDIVEVDNAQPRRWCVWFPFWTEEEGESDLNAMITCIDIEKADGTLCFELDGIRVP